MYQKAAEKGNLNDTKFITERRKSQCYLTLDRCGATLLVYAVQRAHRRVCVPMHAVVRHYFFGWFPLDLFSILPSIFDIIPLVQASNAADEASGMSAEKLSGFRAVRALRLVKLVRLIRASRLLARWQARVGLSHSVLTLLRIIVTLVLATHWCTCAAHQLLTSTCLATRTRTCLRTADRF